MLFEMVMLRENYFFCNYCSKMNNNYRRFDKKVFCLREVIQLSLRVVVV